MELGDGVDAVICNGGDFSDVSIVDGGGGSEDSLTFTNGSASVAGAQILNIERLAVGDGGDVSIAGVLNTDVVAIEHGGRLGGIGTINGDLLVQAGGLLGPGNSPGLMLVTGNLELATGSISLFELGGLNPGTEHDQIDVSGGVATLAAGAIFDIDFHNSFVATLGDSFDVLVADNIIGDLSFLSFDLADVALDAAFDWTSQIVAIDGGREALRLSVIEAVEDAQVPAPYPLSLLGMGALFLLGMRRRRL